MLQDSLKQVSETPKSITSTGCLLLCPLGGAGGKAIFAKDAFPDMISEAFTTWVEYSVTSKNAEPMTSGITCRGIEISIERSSCQISIVGLDLRVIIPSDNRNPW